MLEAARGGRRRAADQLFEAVYSDLRRLAASYLRSERRGHTLQPTALVHEAYLRLIDQTRVDWRGRAHFLAVAAQAMRRLLVDHARGKRREKRGGRAAHVTLDAGLVGADGDATVDVLEVEQALEKLAREEPEKAKLVVLRFYGGLTMEEAAESLGLGLRTAERYWLHARTWMYREMRGPDGAADGAEVR
ncbi:MAG: RNA polymerase subunit sigma-70 [Acidobacteria bacterium]|nr:MAG: RNA polymerase subunit sigma-70 [Acidobacteriota bacterium]REK11352.1 MAG: RNA polymerase subunit sigma-70 [Acidobacteriota bacterium]